MNVCTIWVFQQSWGSAIRKLLAIAISVRFDHQRIAYDLDLVELAKDCDVSWRAVDSALRMLQAKGRVVRILGPEGLGWTFPEVQSPFTLDMGAHG